MKSFIALFVIIASVMLANCEVNKDLGTLKGSVNGKDVCKYEKLVIQAGKNVVDETDNCRKVNCGNDYKGTLSS